MLGKRKRTHTRTGEFGSCRLFLGESSVVRCCWIVQESAGKVSLAEQTLWLTFAASLLCTQWSCARSYSTLPTSFDFSIALKGGRSCSFVKGRKPVMLYRASHILPLHVAWCCYYYFFYFWRELGECLQLAHCDLRTLGYGVKLHVYALYVLMSILVLS